MYSFEKKQLLAILRAAKKASREHWLMMCVAYNHGLRVSELTGKKGFRAKDIHRGKLFIRRLKRGDPCDHDLVRNRNPLLNEAQALIDLAKTKRSDSPVFTICRQHFWRLVKRYAEAADIDLKIARTHSFRHSVAFYLHDAIGPTRLQRYLGHKHGASVMEYGKPKEIEATARAVKALRR